MIKLNKKGMSMIILMIMLFSMLASNVFAIGVSPTKQEIEFVPGMHKEMSLRIINNQNRDMKAVVYARGEMAEYVTFPASIISISAAESLKTIYYSIDLPQELENAGLHEAEIVVMELPSEFAEEDTSAQIKAVGAVVSKLQVRVPYPKKYVEGEMSITTADAGDDVVFTISLFNFGVEDVEEIEATIVIFGPTYEKLGTVKSGKISLDKSQSSKVVAKWNANVNPGVYHAVATVRYDEKTVIIEKNFDVGNKFVEILDISVANFNLGGIAKFDITAKNNWNEDINDIYADFEVSRDRTIMTLFKTPNFNLGPLKEETVSAYWDTTDSEVGEYEVKVTMNYGGKVSERIFPITVNLDSITQRSMLSGEVISGEAGLLTGSAGIMLLVIVLIAINIGWFIYMKKSKRGK